MTDNITKRTYRAKNAQGLLFVLINISPLAREFIIRHVASSQGPCTPTNQVPSTMPAFSSTKNQTRHALPSHSASGSPISSFRELSFYSRDGCCMCLVRISPRPASSSCAELRCSPLPWVLSHVGVPHARACFLDLLVLVSLRQQCIVQAISKTRVNLREHLS